MILRLERPWPALNALAESQNQRIEWFLPRALHVGHCVAGDNTEYGLVFGLVDGRGANESHLDVREARADWREELLVGHANGHISKVVERVGAKEAVLEPIAHSASRDWSVLLA